MRLSCLCPVLPAGGRASRDAPPPAPEPDRDAMSRAPASSGGCLGGSASNAASRICWRTKRRGQAEPLRDGRRGQALVEKHPPRARSRKEELPRKDIGLQFASLTRAIILDALQADRRRLRRACRIDIVCGACRRTGVNADMPDLMGDEQRPLACFTRIFGEDRTALLIEDGARAFQGRVARWQPGKLQIEMADCRVDQLHRLGQYRAHRRQAGNADRRPRRERIRTHPSISLEMTRDASVAPRSSQNREPPP